MPRDSVREIGYLTPDDVPDERICRSFSIPNNDLWLGTFMGALTPLLSEEAWRKYGTLDPDECAAQWQEIFFSFEAMCAAPVDTPYWDSDEDVDDEAPADDQPWYGYVEDPATPPTELDVVEDATIWAFTGLIVLSLGAVGIAPAIAFRTAAKKFVLSYKNGGGGNIIRFFVDGVKIYQGVDTGGGEITDVTVIPDPDEETHQIYVTSEIA